MKRRFFLKLLIGISATRNALPESLKHSKALDSLTRYLQSHVVPKLTDDIFKTSPLMATLKSKCTSTFDGGSYIQSPISYSDQGEDD